MSSWGTTSEWAAAILLLVTTLTVYLLYERYKVMSVFRRLGIPGPPPSLLHGNNHEIRPDTSVSLRCHQRWLQQYGSVFGYNRSGTPVLVVADLELLKRLLIKDFHLFSNRGRVRLTLQAHHDSLLGLRGERWKEVRKTLNPTFTTSKMKQLANIVSRKVSLFETEIDKMAAATQDSSTGFDIYEKFQRMTLVVIGECALAMTIDCQRDPHNATFDGLRQFMSGNYGRLGLLLASFTSLNSLLNWYLNRLPMVTVAKTVTSNLYRAIAARRQAGRDGRSANTIDMLQLMLNTTTATKEVDGDSESDNAVVLTDRELVGNCWAILIAGYETTSTALAYAAHLLTVHQDVQQRVYDEIMAKIKVGACLMSLENMQMR